MQKQFDSRNMQENAEQDYREAELLKRMEEERNQKNQEKNNSGEVPMNYVQLPDKAPDRSTS